MDLNRIKGKTQDLLKQNQDKIEKGVSRAEQFAKSKSKNDKQSARIDRMAGKIRGIIPDDDGKSGPAGPTPPPATP